MLSRLMRPFKQFAAYAMRQLDLIVQALHFSRRMELSPQ